MKKIGTLFFFFALLLPLSPLVAQDDVADDSRAPRPLLLVSTGFGAQMVDPFFKTSYFCIEEPLGPYRQIGLSANVILENYSVYNYDQGVGRNSFEAAFLFKNFFRGRLSARRSPFYMGADLRVGSRTYFENQDFFSGTPAYKEVSCTNIKLMVLTGIQYRLGPALLEFALPLGFERVSSKSSPSEQVNFYYLEHAIGTNMVLLPSIGLGYAFYGAAKTKKKHRKR